MNTNKFNIGFLPVMADLYNRLVPGLRQELNAFSQKLKCDLQNDEMKLIVKPVSCTHEEIGSICDELERESVDLLVLGMVSYTPSGQILPTLLKTKLPLLIWPAQPMLELVPGEYDFNVVLMNHGVHGAQDLSNMLRRKGKAFGILHGHSAQKETPKELLEWVQAARLLGSMRTSNPCFIGGHFEDMLDLQLEDEPCIQDLGVEPRAIDLGQFVAAAKSVTQQQIDVVIQGYRQQYDWNKSLTETLLAKAVRHELALRKLLESYGSTAVGVNFMTLCNHKEIADALHLAACSLMSDGIGYAAEGDWVTAMFLRGVFSARLNASFSEQFSVGYQDNRLVLRHWGEGNPKLARIRPLLKASAFSDREKSEFVVMDFEFRPGPVTLVNLSASVNGGGQLIIIPGVIDDVRLPAVDGPRAVFRSKIKDVRELLNAYALAGGSHHLVLIEGDCRAVLKKTAILAGWTSLDFE